jgi:hypothetical protein
MTNEEWTPYIPMNVLVLLWRLLGDTPTDDEDNIDQSFLGFPMGTPREDIWHWFEASNKEFLVGEIMNQKSIYDHFVKKS